MVSPGQSEEGRSEPPFLLLAYWYVMRAPERSPVEEMLNYTELVFASEIHKEQHFRENKSKV